MGSVLCGVAPDVGLLIAFRALQALGAALFTANAPAILTMTFPPTQRGQVLGMQAMMLYVGLVLGPPLGGLLTDQFGWRSIFVIR